MPKSKSKSLSLRASAERLIQSTRSVLPLGAANRSFDACLPEQMLAMRADFEIKACFHGLTSGGSSVRVLNLLAKVAKEHGCGNCQAQAAVTYQLAKKLSPPHLECLTMASFVDGDHAFIVFNPESDAELLVCPWSGVIGERDEFISKLKVDGELPDGAYGTGEVLIDDSLTRTIKPERVSTDVMLRSLVEWDRRTFTLAVATTDKGSERRFDGRGVNGKLAPPIIFS